MILLIVIIVVIIIIAKKIVVEKRLDEALVLLRDEKINCVDCRYLMKDSVFETGPMICVRFSDKPYKTYNNGCIYGSLK